jgi:hypothetical protein
MSKPDILDALDDLHIQATREKSHHYVGSVCQMAAAEIINLRADNAKMRFDLRNLKRQLEEPHSGDNEVTPKTEAA